MTLPIRIASPMPAKLCCGSLDQHFYKPLLKQTVIDMPHLFYCRSFIATPADTGAAKVYRNCASFRLASNAISTDVVNRRFSGRWPEIMYCIASSLTELHCRFYPRQLLQDAAAGASRCGCRLMGIVSAFDRAAGRFAPPMSPHHAPPKARSQ